MARWCEYPDKWEEVLELSNKKEWTQEEEERLKELRVFFEEEKEVRAPKIGAVYDAIYAGEVVITATADIVANFIGMSNGKFHSLARRHLDNKGAFNGFTIRYSELTAEEYTERVAGSMAEIIAQFDMPITKFARQLDVAQSALNNWVRGAKKPSSSGLTKMSRLTGLTIPEILDGAGTIDPKRIEQVRNPSDYFDIVDSDGNVVLQASLAVTARALGIHGQNLSDRLKRAQRAGIDINGYKIEPSDLTDKEYFDRIDSVITKYAEDNDITADDLLNIAKVQRQSYDGWKRYEMVPKLHSLVKLAEAMDMSVFDLVRGR